jgi:hypothetical protein
MYSHSVLREITRTKFDYRAWGNNFHFGLNGIEAVIIYVQVARQFFFVFESPARAYCCAGPPRTAELCESDFTHLTELGITIGGQAFRYMLYHFNSKPAPESVKKVAWSFLHRSARLSASRLATK